MIKKTTTSTNIQLRLPEGLNARVEKAAKIAQSEKNDFIRSCLDQFIREKYEKDEELLAKIREIVNEAIHTMSNIQC